MKKVSKLTLADKPQPVSLQIRQKNKVKLMQPTFMVTLCDLESPLDLILRSRMRTVNLSEMEFKEFEPRFKSAKTQFKLSTGLNLGTFDTILSGTNHI